MKIIKIFGIILLLMIGLVSAVSPTGLVIDINDIDYHTLDTELILYGYIYDAGTGVIVDNATCEVLLHYDKVEIFEVETNFSENLHMNETLFNKTGMYQIDVYCEDAERGGFSKLVFQIVPETRFGLWTPVEDWTFPIIYLILTLVFILIGINYSAPIIGVLGSLMLIFSYFLIGATSPILFTPLLIVGFLFAFKFATQ